ncbi:hypothetical protein FQN54_009311 [Arachnomyces sp. PD_36]|nr:hypothetical protein FQN54_009311 [Arachnomyces sp. PD_36]
MAAPALKASEAPPAYEDVAPNASTQLPPEPDLSSISLDGTLIYPTVPPATSLYELTHDITAGYSVVGIIRLVPTRQQRENGIPANPRDKPLYDFQQPPLTTDVVEMVGKRRSTLPGTVFLSTKNGIMGYGWEVEHSHGGQKVLLYRTKPSWKYEKKGRLEWQDADGEPVAEETLGGESSLPALKIYKSLDEKMMDILVTSWCARLWLCSQNDLAKGRASLNHEAFKRKIGNEPFKYAARFAFSS